MAIVINNYVIMPDSSYSLVPFTGVTLNRKHHKVVIHMEDGGDFVLQFHDYQDAKDLHKCLAKIFSKIL